MADTPVVDTFPGTFGNPPPADVPPVFDPAAFRQQVLAGSTTGEQPSSSAFREMMLGGAEAVAETGLPLGMGVAGTLAGLATGPFAPVATPTLAALGLFSGWLAGRELKKGIPEKDREGSPFRAGGKVFAESMMFAPTAFFIPMQAGGRVATLLSKIGTSARNAPGAYLTAEGIMALGASGGAGLAEALDPNDPMSQMLGTLAGGLSFTPVATIAQNVLSRPALTKALGDITSSTVGAVNPISWMTDPSGQVQSIKETVGRAGTAVGTAIQSRQQQRAVDTLLRLAEENGQDIPALIRQLEAPDLPGIPPMTAAQKVDNKFLAGLQARLAIGSDRFKPETLEQGENAFYAIQALIQRLKDTGDPTALIAAAKIREQTFDEMIRNRLFAAEAQAANKIGRITKDNAEARRLIGDTYKSEIELALGNARMVEGEFWRTGLSQLAQSGDEAALSIRPGSATSNFLSRVRNISDANFDLLPAPLRNIMRDMGIDRDVFLQYKAGARTPEALQSGAVPYDYLPDVPQMHAIDLLSNRSELMNLARTARAQGDSQTASIYDTVASGILEDLRQLNSPMLDEARAFSKTLNDVFTRTYANDVMSTTGTGAERLSPEDIVRRMGRDTQSMAELTEAVRFPRRTYEDAVSRFGADSEIAQGLQPLVGISDEAVNTITNANRSILMSAAAKSLRMKIDPKTNTEVVEVDPAGLTKFVQENKELLDRLGLTSTLMDARQAQSALDLVRMQNSAINQSYRKQLAFSRVLAAGDDPKDAVSTALSSSKASKEFGNLAKLARADGQEAVDGLKSSFFDHLYEKAGGDGSFDPLKYHDLLFNPLGPKKPSAADILRSQGLMTSDELNNIKKLLDPAIRIQQKLDEGVPLKNFLTGASAVEDWALRLMGINVGTAMISKGPGSLAAASIGSSKFRELFSQAPMMEMRRVIEVAALDPTFMAELLKRGRTQREQFETAKKLRGYLLSAGLAATIDEPEEPENVSPFPPVPAQGSRFQSREALRQLPVAPTTRGVPGLTPPGQQSPGPQGAAPGQPSQSRAMLQSLFPFDTISGMAAQQPPPPG